MKQSRLDQKESTSSIVVIFYRDTQAIWGIFSSSKKALRAITNHRIDPSEIYYLVYELDTRYMKARPAYASDLEYVGPKSLEELDSFPAVRGNDAASFGTLVDPFDIPNTTKRD